MKLSDSSKAEFKRKLTRKEKELIQEWEWFVEPDAGFPDGWGPVQWIDAAPALLPVRDEIEKRGLANHPKVMEIDRQLIKQVLEYGSDPSGEEHPIDKWWWHLEKIAQRTYPASLLPEHLREIYEKYKFGKKLTEDS